MYENISQKPLRSSTVTPSSFSESSFDEARSSKSHEMLTERGSTKKRVNIRTDLDNCMEKHSPQPYEDLESGETSILNTDQQSLDRFNAGGRKLSDGYLTMTGTIKRGKKTVQEFNVQLNISRDELEKISAAAAASMEPKKQNGCGCSLSMGLHVFLWSVICFPFVLIVTSVYSFYLGTITWYNIFNYFNEEKTYLHKLFMSPILIVLYPLVIIVCTLGLGVYASFKQLKWSFRAWYNEVSDLEKGFYNWLCSALKLSVCSPYEVVILTDIRDNNEPIVQSAEELSL